MAEVRSAGWGGAESVMANVRRISAKMFRAFYIFFYHVHMLRLVCDLHASKRNVVVLVIAYHTLTR